MPGDTAERSPPSGGLTFRRDSLTPRLDGFDVLLLSILLIEFAGVGRLPFHPSPFGDLNFYTEAKALAAALRGAGAWSEVAVTRGPAPVVYYAIAFLAVPLGSSDRVHWWAGFVWNVWWMAVALLCLRRAATALGGRAAGIAAGALFLASPFSVYYSFAIDAEPPAYLAAAVLAYAWAAGAGRGSSESAPSHLDVPWLAALALSFLLLSRPNAVLVLAILGISALRLRRKSMLLARAEARRMSWIVILAAAATLIATAVVRALPSTPAGSPQLENLSHVIVQGRFQYRGEPFDWRYWDNETRGGSADYSAWVHTLDSLARQSRATRTPVSTLRWQWIGTDLREHPGITLRSAAVRVLTLNLALVNSSKPESFRVGPISGRAAYTMFHVAVNLSWLTVLALCLRQGRRHRGYLAAFAPLWGPWVALLVFHLFTYAEPRYLFPGQPGLVVMAATGLAPLVSTRRRVV